MKNEHLLEELKKVLNHICIKIGERPTGSKANRELETYARNYFENNGFNIELQQFECIDWENQGARLIFNDQELKAKPSYYTKSCDLEAEFIKLTTIEELANSDLQDKIAVLSGELTEEQLMPKSFTFYNPERHQRIISLLEEKASQAIITVVDNDISVLEDGDFQIPSVYISKAEGQKLLNGQGEVRLNIKTARKDSSGANLIARINPAAEKKLVITAHMDTKYGTPGALDNGTGVAILLLLSSIIKPADINYSLEFAILNGEDYYSTPGQIKYLDENIKGNESIFLVINCDGVGLKESKTAISFLELAEDKRSLVKDLLSSKTNVELIEPWQMGDHMLFVMNGIPAITLTSKKILSLIDEIAHTEKDSIELIDYQEVINVINLVLEILLKIESENI